VASRSDNEDVLVHDHRPFPLEVRRPYRQITLILKDLQVSPQETRKGAGRQGAAP
jgi:hypothetical protein